MYAAPTSHVPYSLPVGSCGHHRITSDFQALLFASISE